MFVYTLYPFGISPAATCYQAEQRKRETVSFSSSSSSLVISGPTDLQVVKTTSTSAVVQWEQSQGEIDRYRLTVTPNDGAGRPQEMTVPAGQNSAHIQQLEAGRLYDVILVAEKGTSRSEPETTQVTPGEYRTKEMNY